ncbi:MAG TPA: hypothetical protein PKE64_27215, partial [Anaerolineae bacterium]|nr:hypothetical protein [Anaerolineae bacterium]
WYGPGGPPLALPTPVPSDTGPAPTPVATQVVPPTPGPPPPPPPRPNLIENGNFEFGFYNVGWPALGFEPGQSGAVPQEWGWYKSKTHGKVRIYDNQSLGIACDESLFGEPPERTIGVDDPRFGYIPGLVIRNTNISALGLEMQSTDEQDMRLGVYQTVDVTPGVNYRFSMKGTFQIQSGATTLQPEDPRAPEEDQNHSIELYFDHTGNTDWKAIPHKQWTQIEFEEQKLEFRASEDDEDLAEVQDYVTFVTAQSNKMTIFLTFWRKWANWRTGIASLDCIALTPATAADIRTVEDRRRNVIDLSQSTVAPASGAQPAAAQPGLPVTGQDLPAQPLDSSQPEAQPEQPIAPVQVEPVNPPEASLPVEQPQPERASSSEPAAPVIAAGQPQVAQPAAPVEAAVAELTASNEPAVSPRPVIDLGRVLPVAAAAGLAAIGLVVLGVWRLSRR